MSRNRLSAVPLVTLLTAAALWPGPNHKALAGGPPLKPSLRIQLVTPSSLSPSIGQPISVTVTVQNTGGVEAGPFDVDLFYNRPSPPSVGENGDQSMTVALMAPNSSTSVVFTGVTSLTEGTWYTYAIVDTDNVVDESNETDNVSTPKQVNWNAPDLVIDAITPSNSGPAVGETISVTVSVKNAGTGEAGAFSVDLFHNLASPPSLGETGDQSKAVASLAPGKSANVSFTGISSATAGAWEMYAIANTDGAVLESDASNNVGGPVEVVWGEVGTAPDLTITAITPSNPTPDAGSTITVDVTVENEGDAPVGSFRLDLFYDLAAPPGPGDTGDKGKSVGGLAAGESTVVALTGVSSAVPADWSMYAIVDTLDNVAESDETNNVAGPAAVQWRGVDLVVTAITPSDSAPVIGSTITVDVTVENMGNADVTDPFDVGLFDDPGVAPAPGSVADRTQTVAALAAGASTVLSFAGVTSAAAGAWDMYAVADNAVSPGAVLEYDETNNVAGPAAVVWTAPDLVVLSIAPSNASPTAGDTISVVVTVRNQGDAAAGAFDVGLYFDEPAAPAPGDPGTNGKGTPQSVGALDVGAETTVTFPNVTSGVAGTWQMYAAADDKAAGGDVAEGDEANNVAGPIEVIWGAAGTSPDLVVLSVVPLDADPSIGNMISVDVTVANQGTAAAGGFVVALFYDEGAPPSVGDAADRTQGVASLAQGTQTVVTFADVTSAVTGPWSMYAVADNANAVAEQAPAGDETNNVSAAAAVTWHAPELLVTSITPSSTDPDVGGAISVDVTVRNDGDAPAGAFVVALFHDRASPPAVGDAPDETQAVASLAAGAETVLTFVGITSLADGTWSMYAAVDNGFAVAESDESDNVDGPETVTWHGPDLVVSSVTPSDSTPTISDTISVDVTVVNLGDRDAGYFDVALFYDEGSSPSVGDVADQTQAVVSLSAGGVVTVTFAGVTNSVEEVWETWATVDNGSAITEGDEANNTGGPATITWGSPPVPDLLVVSVVPSDASPNTGDAISVDVTVANNGTSDASLFDVALFFDPPGAPSPGDPADRTKGVGTLAAGAQTTLTFTSITSGTPDVWQMYALVDSGDVIAEENESNNTDGPVEVNWGAVAGITVLVPDGGESWKSGTVQQVTWDSYGAAWSNVTIEYSLNAGTDWTVEAASTPDDGVYDWNVPLADSAQCLVRVTSEGGSYSDESDDFFTISPAGAGEPNLKVVSISPSTSLPNAGDVITVDVTVRNTGSATSGLFYVDLFFNRSSEPSPGETGDRSKAVSILAAGAEASVTFLDISSASAGLWNTYTVVDTQGYVGESNEEDNVSGPVTIGWSTTVDTFRVSTPDGGEVLELGKTHTVYWTWTGNPGALVNIEVSTNGGSTWEQVVASAPNDGSCEWLVSTGPSSDCRLRVSNFSGGVADVSDGLFTINAPPVSSFTADPASGSAPLSVSFDGTGSTDAEGPITSYEWDFDYDGVPANFSADAFGAATMHLYDTGGAYTAALRVTDGHGAVEIHGMVINVNSPPTAAALADPATGVRPLAVSFDGATSSDPDGVVVSYEWDFDYCGDPADFTTDATGPFVAHTYDRPGLCTAALRVTDADGAKDIDTVEIVVDSQLYFGAGCGADGQTATGVGAGRWGPAGFLVLFLVFVASRGLVRRRPARGKAPTRAR